MTGKAIVRRGYDAISERYRQVRRARRLVPAARFVRADVTDLRFEDGVFDAVVGLYVLIHLPQDEQRQVIRNVARWLRPGGVLLATVGVDGLTGEDPDWLGAGHRMWWSHPPVAETRAWLRDAGFRIERDEFVPEGSGGHQLVVATRRLADHRRDAHQSRPEIPRSAVRRISTGIRTCRLGSSRTMGPVALTERELAAKLVHGARPVRVELAEPDPAWAERFAVRAAELRRVLGDRARLVEHIGSTSVPGLAAKPIVDIVVGIDDPDDEPAYLPDLEAIGYDLRVREPGHRCLRAGEPDEPVNLHCYPPDDDEVRKYLLFRDHLRVDEADRRRYEATKRSLVGDWPDVNHYADAKGPVIRAILRRAGWDG